MNNLSKEKLILSRRLDDRILLIIFCTILIFIVGGIALAAHTWKVDDLTGQIVKICIIEIFFTFFIFSVLGLMWGLVAPKWLENIIQTQSNKIMLIVKLIIGGTVLTIMYFILFVD